MKAIYLRELKSYFSSLTGYAFIAFMLFFAGVYTMSFNLSQQLAHFEYVYSNMTLIFIFLTPIITMRAIAEERKQKTDQLLYALPVSMSEVVMGKYLAMITVLAVPLLVISVYPLILSNYGDITFATVYGTQLAFFLLGAALIAMGLFISSLTESQAIAAVLCILVVLVNYFMSSLAGFLPGTAPASAIALTITLALLCLALWSLVQDSTVAMLVFILGEGALLVVMVLNPTVLEGLFPRIMESLSVFDNFYDFVYGVFDITSIVFFLSVIFLFVFLTVQSLEKRRWS